MKRTLFLWLFGLILTAQVYAQNRSLSGTIKDAATGEALIGVNVTGKGTTIGTVTDIDGKYSLELPKDVTTLVFSYIGYTNLEKSITALKIDAAMTAEGKALEEVVVTAGAIKREKRSLNFQVNTIKSEDLAQGSTDVFSAIQSKTPGVRVTSASGAPGSTKRIVLGGETSFLGGNNALIVIDGVPVNNEVNNGRLNTSANYIDFGNRGNDYNPDDVESITVLRGPAAVAQYGSRGTNGVVMITTKSGKGFDKADKKFSVSINSGVSFQMAYLQIKRQDKFGQGYDNTPDPIENFSWGPAFDGVVRPWTPAITLPSGVTSQLIRPYSAVKNQLKDALDLGITYNSGLSVEGGTDKFTYYFSYGNVDNKGIFQNTFYKRNSLTASASAKFNEKFSSTFKVQYSKVNQRALLGASSGNFGGPYQALLQQATNIPLNELRDYNSDYHNFIGYYGGYTANPYYLMNNINNNNKTDNLLASVELEFKPVEYIKLTSRIGNNFTLSQIDLQNPKYSYVPKSGQGASDPGSYAHEVEKRNQLNLDLIAAFDKEVVKNFNIGVTAGFRYTGNSSDRVLGYTQGGLVVPGFYNLSNSAGNALNQDEKTNRAILGVYSTISFGYKNMLFADYTISNDWSSTLPEGKRGYYYQAGGLSFVVTEAFKKKSEWFNYMKLRFNAGTQGKDALAYRLNTVYNANPVFDDYSDGNLQVVFPVIGLNGSNVSGFTLDNRIGNPNLKPEITIEYEAGADITFLKEYLNLEYTFRHRTSKDLLVDVSLPASSGYRVTAKNIGKIRNISHELLARVSVLRNIKNINWDINLAFSKLNNKVLKVSDETDEIALNTGGVQIVAKEGLPFGTFKATDYVRDPNGNIVVNNLGVPIESTDYSYFGSYIPKYTIGLGSTLSWNGLSFGIQFDIKEGGTFYSGTKAATDFNGTSLSSLLNNREPYIVPTSVQDANGGIGTPRYVENTTPVTNLYNIVGSLPESQNLIDASYIKLREVSLAYTFSKKFFKNTPLSAITLSLIANNLKFWLPKENVFADPESNSFGGAGDVQGLEFSSTPQTRSVGFDLKIKF
ncbi:MAG TPA: SusC/RagA family TonB-linked outer membrane protein [Chitinophagales bacterium]|nr:SusC/RagA family TonB-linked outer membrane protein [Chitinophagales bacterium]